MAEIIWTKGKTLNGTKGNDTIDGSNYTPDKKNKGLTIKGNTGNDDITGSSGDDTITCGAGQNIYNYSVGNGTDTITLTKNERLTLNLLGLTQDDLKFDIVKSNLEITFNKQNNNNKGKLILKGYATKDVGTVDITFDGSNLIHLANMAFDIYATKNYTGSRFNEEIHANITKATNAKKNTGLTINGGLGDDTLYGSRFNDTLVGGKGKDTFVFEGSFGEDIIKDGTSEDKIKFNDAEIGDLKFYKNGNHLEIRQGDNKVTVNNYFKSTNKINTLIDSTGAGYSLSAQQFSIAGKGTIKGTTASDDIIGSDSTDTIKADAGNDTISAGKGNDKIYGGAGKDTFIFYSADGTDTIKDASSDDIIEFKNLTPEQLLFKQNKNNLEITNKVNSKDKVIIENFYKTNSKIDKIIVNGEEYSIADNYLSTGSFTPKNETIQCNDSGIYYIVPESTKNVDIKMGSGMHILDFSSFANNMHTNIKYTIYSGSGTDYISISSPLNNYTKSGDDLILGYSNDINGESCVDITIKDYFKTENNCSVKGTVPPVLNSDFGMGFIEYDEETGKYIWTNEQDLYKFASLSNDDVAFLSDEIENLYDETTTCNTLNTLYTNYIAKLITGNGTINGTTESEIIQGSSSADTINGNGGADIIYGGDGNDTIYGSNLSYNEDGDYYNGFSEYPTAIIYGGKGNDEIHGGNINDDVDGDYRIYGGEGKDTIHGGNLTDGLYLITAKNGSGATIVGGNIQEGGYGSYFIFGSDNADEIQGGNSPDLGEDAYTISAGKGNDIIHAGEYNTVSGGEGNDTIYGGNSDKYVYNYFIDAPTNQKILTNGVDTIKDSNSSDTIYIRAAINNENNWLTKDDLTFTKNGNNLEITNKLNTTDKIIIEGYYTSEDKIDNIAIVNGVFENFEGGDYFEEYDFEEFSIFDTMNNVIRGEDAENESLTVNGTSKDETIYGGDLTVNEEFDEGITYKVKGNGGSDTIYGGNLSKSDEVLNGGMYRISAKGCSESVIYGGDITSGEFNAYLIEGSDGNDEIHAGNKTNIESNQYFIYGTKGNDTIYSNDGSTFVYNYMLDKPDFDGDIPDLSINTTFNVDTIKNTNSTNSIILNTHSNDTSKWLTKEDLTFTKNGDNLEITNTLNTANKIIIENYYTSEDKIDTIVLWNYNDENRDEGGDLTVCYIEEILNPDTNFIHLNSEGLVCLTYDENKTENKIYLGEGDHILDFSSVLFSKSLNTHYNYTIYQGKGNNYILNSFATTNYTKTGNDLVIGFNFDANGDTNVNIKIKDYFTENNSVKGISEYFNTPYDFMMGIPEYEWDEENTGYNVVYCTPQEVSEIEAYDEYMSVSDKYAEFNSKLITGTGTINGTSGDDIIIGSASADTINGGGGADKIFAGAGNDTIYGGNLNNNLNDGTLPMSKIYGGKGNDEIHGGNLNGGVYYIYGGEGKDVIYGGDIAGSDENGSTYWISAKGGNGARIYGGDINSEEYEMNGYFITGSDGNDYIEGGNTQDPQSEEPYSNYTISAGKGNDEIHGGEFNYINGGEGNDTIYGGKGNIYSYNYISKDYNMEGMMLTQILSNGIDTIKNSNSSDTIYITRYADDEDGFLDGSKLTFTKKGNNLEITNTVNTSDKIIIENYYTSNDKIDKIVIYNSLYDGSFDSENKYSISEIINPVNIIRPESSGLIALKTDTGKDTVLYLNNGNHIISFDYSTFYNTTQPANYTIYSGSGKDYLGLLDLITISQFERKGNDLFIGGNPDNNGESLINITIKDYYTSANSVKGLCSSNDFYPEWNEETGDASWTEKHNGYNFASLNSEEVLEIENSEYSNYTAISSYYIDFQSKLITGTGTIYGTTGDDIIIGSDSADTIKGKGGADTIYAGDGNDNILGGNFSPVYDDENIFSPVVNIYGGKGNDTIQGGDIVSEDMIDGFMYTIHGGDGNDTITGGNIIDENSYGMYMIYGDDGDDYIQGGGNNNFDDDYDEYSYQNIIYGGKGNDEIHAGYYNFVSGDEGNDTIYGGKYTGYSYTYTDKYYSWGMYNKAQTTYGIDTIKNSNSTDTIIIQTLFDSEDNFIDKDNLIFTKNGNNLEITNTINTTDKIIIENYYTSENKIDNLRIINQCINMDVYEEYEYSIAQILDPASFIKNGTNGNDNIIGQEGRQYANYEIYAKGGNDIIIGAKYNRIDTGSGNDTISSGGNSRFVFDYTKDNSLGTDIIRNATSSDTIRFITDEELTSNDFQLYKNGNNLEISNSINPNDKIIIEDYFISEDKINYIALNDQNENGVGINNEINNNYYFGEGINEVINFDYEYHQNYNIYAGAGTHVIDFSSDNDYTNCIRGEYIINSGIGNNYLNINTAYINYYAQEGNDLIIGAGGWSSDGTSLKIKVKDYFNPDVTCSVKGFTNYTKQQLNNINYNTVNYTPLNNLYTQYMSGAITGSGTINGTSGNDKIFGSSSNDVIYGNGGYDFIYSGAGDDKIYTTGYGQTIIFAGDGNDEIHCGGQADIVYGGKGEDTIYLGNQTDAYGGNGNDTYILSNSYNYISDENGNDIYDARNVDLQNSKISIYDYTGNNLLLLSNKAIVIFNIASYGYTGSTIIFTNNDEPANSYTNFNGINYSGDYFPSNISIGDNTYKIDATAITQEVASWLSEYGYESAADVFQNGTADENAALYAIYQANSDSCYVLQQ